MLKKDMFLESPSGFFMPFSGEDGSQAEMMLDYGEQVHPATGKSFFHHGIDFVCDHQELYAVASGLVTGVGKDEERGDFIAVRYGKYVVRYCHISEALVSYSAKVVAGQQIAKSGDFLHIDVHFAGEELNPIELLTMLYGNISVLASLGEERFPVEEIDNVEVHTKYDADQEEIQSLMVDYFPKYFMAVSTGRWQPSEKTELIIRNMLAKAAEGNCFYEVVPSYSNPLGLGVNGGPLIGEMQNLLIEDFLGYLASHHGIYLSSFTDEQKKKLMSMQRNTARS